MTRDVAMVYSSGQTELATMVNGRMTISTDKESLIIHRAKYMKVTGRMASKVAMAYASGQTDLATMGNGRMTNRTENESIISLMD